LLLLNHHWARDTSTFSTERHRVQFALILLLLFGTGCRPAELVDAKKKRKDTSFDDDDLDDNDLEAVDNDDPLVIDKSDDGFGAEDNMDFSGRESDTFEGDVAMSGVGEDVRQFDAICYEDVRLLVVHNPGSRERDVLAMEVTMAHHKGHKRRPKP
jgi:hypothetical protein